jgi:DNA-binding transcriptional LysR family regulator
METELARTFLAVIAAGNFISAAERLHVTQSTVSARIHTLEEQLGCSLFVRNKAGTRLTAAGRQFQKHAAIRKLVNSLRRDAHEEDQSCWLHAADCCLSSRAVEAARIRTLRFE